MKLLVSPSKIEDIDTLINLNISSFLFGIKHLSLYHNFYIDIEELKQIKNKYQKIEMFVSLNKLMHNYDLALLKETLKELELLDIKGVLYDDVAVLSLGSNLNLIWASTHLVTNYHTINTLSNDIKGALLSSEITLEESINIKQNTKLEIIMPIFGYQIMTTSKRTLISNYKRFINNNIDTDIYYLKDSKELYPVIEDENGTHILTAKILNGLEEIDKLKECNMDYLYLNGLNIDNHIFNKVVRIYNDKLNNIENKDDINKLIPNTDKLFLYKESYFKVNANDKE